MKHVFISYSRSDADFVDVIKKVCDHFQVNVWIDTGSISGGTLWRESINNGIRDCTVFIACLSKNYFAKRESYIVEELRAGLDKLASAEHTEFRFVPFKLEDYDTKHVRPDLLEPLHNMHIIDISKTGLEPGLQELMGVLLPVIKPDAYWFFQLQKILKGYVRSKIEHFTTTRAMRFVQIEDAWQSLTEESLVKVLSPSFVACMEKAKLTGQPQTERLLLDNKIILLTYAPNLDPKTFKNSLTVTGTELRDRYLQYILEVTRECRGIAGWEDRDFVHILYFSDGSDWILDLLYVINFSLTLVILGYFVSLAELPEPKTKHAITFEHLYPTYLINSIDHTHFSNLWLQESQTLHQSDNPSEA